MTQTPRYTESGAGWSARLSVVSIVLATLCLLLPSTVWGGDAESLRSRHAALRTALATNDFQRPLVMQSSESASRLEGEVFAQIVQPYTVIAPVMLDIDHWCGLLILHLNVKGCLASQPGQPAVLKLHVGRKYYQELDEAYPFEFEFHIVTSTPGYLLIELNAKSGPLGTRHYRMQLEIAALDAGQSFLHLSYAYEFGFAARMAMRGYLTTLGREKRGFSVVSQQDDGTPVYIDGTRGVIERNTMRYFIAIDTYLGTLFTPESLRLEERLHSGYDSSERYPLQLHELERDEYLSMKRREVQRMQKLNDAASR